METKAVGFIQHSYNSCSTWEEHSPFYQKERRELLRDALFAPVVLLVTTADDRDVSFFNEFDELFSLLLGVLHYELVTVPVVIDAPHFPRLEWFRNFEWVSMLKIIDVALVD